MKGEFQSQIIFFSEYVEDAEALVTEADANEDKTALRMLYDIFRFPMYADKIRGIPRSTEQIEMFFLVTLCEALYNLYEPESALGSKQKVLAFFNEFLENDAEFFKYKWTRSIVDDQGGDFLNTEELVTVLYDLRFLPKMHLPLNHSIRKEMGILCYCIYKRKDV